MSFGVTTEGFILKRLQDIKLELEDDLRELFGEIDVNPDGPFGQIIGVMARHLAEIWEQAEKVYYGMYPASAVGLSLDGVAQMTGIVRLSSTESTVVAQIEGTEGTTVPDGNLASQSIAGNIFEQQGSAQISINNLHQVIVNVDSDTDQTWEITISGTVVQYVSSGNTAVEIASNLAANIDADLTLEPLIEVIYSPGDEFFTLKIKNLLDPELNPIRLTIDRFFTVVLGTDLSATQIWSPANYYSVDTGDIPVPIASLDTIENPVAGFNTIVNFEDGVPGRNPETDVEFRERRAESLQILGAATIGAIQARVLQEVDNVTAVKVLENRTDEWDPGPSPVGMPPHSIEVIVEGGTNEDIAEKIWEVKAAGIQTYGNTMYTIIDSNGDPQDIYFSRPATVYLYVRVDYDKTGSEEIFPTEGEATMRNNIYALGATHNVGEDVILQRFFGPVYAVQGITNAVIYLAEDVVPDNPSPSWVATNIVIDAQEIAIFENSVVRIVINDVTP